MPQASVRLRGLLPYLVVAGLFCLGLFALYRLLAPVDLAGVVTQMRGTGWNVIGLAVLTTVAAYLCLAGYDWSALRYIGRPLPVPVVLTGGMMAYAFGNSIGLTAVTGGAVRWRFYSGLGLAGRDIAAVSAFAAVSFGISATLVGLIALAFHPQALVTTLPLDPATLRALAIGGALAIVGPLFWASLCGCRVGIGRHCLRVPSPRLLGAQLLFGVGDICLSGLVLYLLLPGQPPDFSIFLAVFAAATMAGVISHVPGGVGVFETVLIAALPGATDMQEIAAALLLFRVIYYLLPFCLALAMLSAFEAWRAFGQDLRRPGGRRLQAAVEPAFRAIQPLAPLLLAVMVFGAGLWMSAASLLPPSAHAPRSAESLFLLAFVEGSSLLASALGAALIVLSLGLARCSLGAFSLTVLAMIAGAAVLLFQQADAGQALSLLAGVLVLAPFRGAFHRRSLLTHSAMTPGWIILIVAALAGLGFVLFFAHKGTPYANELWWQFAADERAPRALRAGLLTSLTVALAALSLLLRTPRHHPVSPSTDDLDAAALILRGEASPLAGFALMGDKTILLSDDRQAFVMFGAAGSSWIAYGSAVGPAEAAEEVAFTFVDSARRSGARPVFYEIGPEAVPLMLDLGMTLHKMGEEAVVDLTGFSLEGPVRKRLRTTCNRAGRDGLELDLWQPPHDDALFAEIAPISDAWLTAKKSVEKGFSVGRFDRDWLNRWPIAVVRQNGRALAFANILTSPCHEHASLDLMRYRAEAPSNTMEFLFIALIQRLKADGYRRFSLGMAPLSGLSQDRSRKLWDRFGSLVYRHGGGFYSFEGLRAFKAKFGPEWQPRYLATPTGMPPLLPLADAARLIARSTAAPQPGLPEERNSRPKEILDNRRGRRLKTASVGP